MWTSYGHKSITSLIEFLVIEIKLQKLEVIRSHLRDHEHLIPRDKGTAIAAKLQSECGVLGMPSFTCSHISLLGQEYKRNHPITTPAAMPPGSTASDSIVTHSNPPVNPPGPSFVDTTALLHWLYADLSRLHYVASSDIILHRADRSLSPEIQPIVGVEAAQAHEEALIAATGDTLKMDVQSVVANQWFGAVLGILRAGSGNSIGSIKFEMPFCGVWRFADGKAVEHWENGNPEAFSKWLAECHELKQSG